MLAENPASAAALQMVLRSLGRPQPVKKGMTGVKLDHAHGSGIGIREDGLASKIRNDFFIAFYNFMQGLIP